MPANEPIQAGTIDKRHALLSQLTPALELKVLGTHSLTIPFNYITNFEFDVMQMQAHVELFDSSFYLIDTFAFILAQVSAKRIPIKMRWGYAFNSSTPTITNERVQTANQSFYMSKEYDFVVFKVESNPTEKGSKVTIHFFCSIVDPVLTSVPVKKVFISGDLASMATNSTDLTNTIIKKWEKGNADEKKRAETAKKIIEQATKLSKKDEATIRAEYEKTFGPGVEIVSNKGRLTFTEIYFRLMNIAREQQNKLGFDRKEEWEVPLPVFPPEFDNNIDYLVFDCSNENVWSNLQKLGSMMISKDTRKPGQEPRNLSQTGEEITKTEERFKMVGGSFTFHSSNVDSPILGSSLYKEAGNIIKYDQIPAKKRAFAVWSFIESPYEVAVLQDPVAYYKYHAGLPGKFDPNNITEVLEFSADFNNASQYFIAVNGFGLQNVRNTKTGAEIDTRSIESSNEQDIKNIQSQSQKSLTTGGGNKELLSESSTNPSADKNTNKGGGNSLSSSPDQSTKKKFEIPAQINPDRDQETLKNFDAAIKSSVSDRMKVFTAEMTIVGDPRFDAVFMTYNKSVYFEFINKQGNTNPIYTGNYIIKNIKHAISTGKYVTMLSLQALPENTTRTGKSENSFINASSSTQGFGEKATTAGESITNAQITVLIARDNNKWKAQDVSAYVSDDYKDTSRVDVLLSGTDNNNKNIKTTILENANKIISSVDSDKFEEVSKQVVGKLIVSLDTKQKLGGATDTEVKNVKFNIKKVDKS